MIFNIRPLNEAIMEDVQVDFFRYPDDGKEKGPEQTPGLTESLRTLDTGKLGLITRGVIRSLEIRIHNREDLAYWLKADKVRVNLRKRELRMSGVRICDQKENQKVLTRKAIWKESEERIHIPGEFVIYTPKGQTKGKGCTFHIAADWHKRHSTIQ